MYNICMQQKRGMISMDHKSVSMDALFLALCLWLRGATAEHDYGEALTKSLLFFEAQRSGYLPSSQRVEWRANSGLGDGKINGVDLVGGYYDAGDNVKFGLPMAFTITMLCWSIIEYGDQLDESGELQNAIDAVKWGTDYFMKAHPQPNVLYGEVGDGDSDHYCWQRPEDMTTSRGAYKIDADHPGSDLAGETAAAMAAASVVFHRVNSSYAADLLKHAAQLFDFADKYRGKYDDSIFVAQKYYRSFSGYADELLWGAAWLYKATNKDYYLDYLGNNGDELGGTGWAINQFGWDVKYAGVQTLVAKLVMAGKGGKHAPTFERYKEKAEFFMCSCTAGRTPGGLIFRQRWNNMQFVTTASFLMTVYSDYLASASRSLACADGPVSPPELLALAKSQVDYILGHNPREISYMVGYGKNYPLQVHHRAASIVSYKVDPSFVSCREGYGAWFDRNTGNPNILTGAVVGGPDADDKFDDRRDNYEQTEPATYNTAPLVGVLARLHATHNWISIHQRVTTSWIEKGKTLYRYSGVVTNKSPKKVKNLMLRILNLNGPLWGLTKSGDYYFFPEWIDSLDAGHSIEFVYIHSGSEADISVLSYALV